MLGFPETFGAVLGSFLGPAFVGLVIIFLAARKVPSRYLAAFAIGLYLWFFQDTIGGANLLDVNEGFGGGVWQVVLWVLFAAGVIIFFSIDKSLFADGVSGDSFGFAIPILVAIAVGLHGGAEGGAIGSTAATTPSNNLLDAFGGLTAAIAFMLHKGLEPMMVGAAYWVYAKQHASDTSGRIRDIIILTIAFTLPGIVVGGASYYLVQAFPSVDFTYIYGLGLGASVYALVRLARPLFRGTGANSEALKTAIVLLFGFLCLYVAALLHS